MISLIKLNTLFHCKIDKEMTLSLVNEHRGLHICLDGKYVMTLL